MITWGIFRLASLAGTRSASSEPCHLIRKNRSPGSLVAPMILSGFKPRANPRDLVSSDFFEPEIIFPTYHQIQFETCRTGFY